MSDVTIDRFKFLTPRGRIPANTMCPFVNMCKTKDERCNEVKSVDFSCGTARLIDMFYDELKGGK